MYRHIEFDLELQPLTPPRQLALSYGTFFYLRLNIKRLKITCN